MAARPFTRLCAWLAVAMLVTGTAGAAEVYRWVDENGEVHYSESLPPELRESQYDVLNSSGLVIKQDQSMKPPPPKPEPKEDKETPQELPRDSSGLPRPKALYSEAEMQRRMDTFLMLRYESEKEIIDAMNVEIKQLNYDRRLLETSRHSMMDAFVGHVKQAGDRQRAGLEVSEEASREINQLQARLAENQSSLDILQAREDDIRAEFDKQLVRYRYLKEELARESAEGS
jgi:hypothetical protein